MSGKIATRAGGPGPPPACHVDLQMVNRHVKLLPQPGEDDAAARLNDYLGRSQDFSTRSE
jgi:hypothetical protein